MFDFFKRKDKSPRFFCENCGAEVPGNSKNCPKCGRSFASIRCPACNFIGDEAQFRNGCPSCGLSPGSKPGKKSPKESPIDENRVQENKVPAGALPVWVYILTAAVFTAVLAALFFNVFR